MIDDGGNLIVGRNAKKIFRELLVLAQVDLGDVVLHARFFEKNRDLVAVWRGPIMVVDHGKLLPELSIEDVLRARMRRRDHAAARAALRLSRTGSSSDGSGRLV